MDSIPCEPLEDLGFDLRNFYCRNKSHYAELFLLAEGKASYAGSLDAKEFLLSLMSCAVAMAIFRLSGQFYIEDSSLIFKYTESNGEVIFKIVDGNLALITRELSVADFCKTVGALSLASTRSMIEVSGDRALLDMLERPQLYIALPR